MAMAWAGWIGVLAVAWLVALAAPAAAVMSGGESRRAPSSDADYAAGTAAFERKDWPAVIEHLAKVIERRPWHDNAHSLMGFAYRKLGDYDRSLRFYSTALELNPHNRGALEYLGEAYLEMDRLAEAEAVLVRLEQECKRIAVGFSNGGWKSGCEEWQDLKAAHDAYRAGRPLPEHD
jgi:tetratricopeptide (TPR) repeat protein